MKSESWPVIKSYGPDHLGKIAMPLGGIGTGTVSLGGRGNLRDWELMNRPAKKFTPGDWRSGKRPGFLINICSTDGSAPVTRLLEGPLELYEYEGQRGSEAVNHGMPRFRDCTFKAAYPLGQVELSDPDVPVKVVLEAYNPLVPGDADVSGVPIAILRYVVTNTADARQSVSICGSLPNFIGHDGTDGTCEKNVNRYRAGEGIQGIYLSSDVVSKHAQQWGSMAIATKAGAGCEVSCRTDWLSAAAWGTPKLDFWDDFSGDGILENRPDGNSDSPQASIAVKADIDPGETRAYVFLIAWYFPNRYTWTPDPTGSQCCSASGACDCSNNVGNYYATQYSDAWNVVEKTVPRLAEYEERTLEFVRAFCLSDVANEVKEAALFNLSTLRSQTCFRTRDGFLFGWEGCNDTNGCCEGSCTHVWNYEQAVAFLYGDLALSMRRIEFEHCTNDEGRMVFRVSLPLDRAQAMGKAAADGQMGCIMKVYRDWQLSGNSDLMISLLPKAKRALEFCWIPGGWDADKDGVMEGCQHNTMDVEYYGPNPQMGIWYLGALRAAEEMTRFAGDVEFADTCRELFESGKTWIDKELFNGSYYEHQVRAPEKISDVNEALRLNMGAKDVLNPDYQLANGCLVDQLVGQFLAHVCGLGYLVDPDHVTTTLRSIWKYNRKTSFHDHFNTFRSYVLGDEAALLMAAYPNGRPENPFPYFTEVMTGFEYTAAIGMLYEGQVDEGIECIRDIRNRYDGRKRSPFDEAECGHHYARAMASWAAILALTGFHYSGVEKSMRFGAEDGSYFWSNGWSWGTVNLGQAENGRIAKLEVLYGTLQLKTFEVQSAGKVEFDDELVLKAGDHREIVIN